jgi:hypothetical protein
MGITESTSIEATKDQQATFKALDNNIRQHARGMYFNAKEFAQFVAQAYAQGELFWKFHGKKSWDEYAADVFAKEVPADMGKALRDALIAELHEAKLSTRRIQRITGTSTGTTMRAISEHARKAAGAQLAKSGSAYKAPAPRTVTTTPPTAAAKVSAILDKLAEKWGDFDSNADGWKVSDAELQDVVDVLANYSRKAESEQARRAKYMSNQLENARAKVASLEAAAKRRDAAANNHPAGDSNNRNPRSGDAVAS